MGSNIAADGNIATENMPSQNVCVQFAPSINNIVFEHIVAHPQTPPYCVVDYYNHRQQPIHIQLTHSVRQAGAITFQLQTHQSFNCAEEFNLIEYLLFVCACVEKQVPPLSPMASGLRT